MTKWLDLLPSTTIQCITREQAQCGCARAWNSRLQTISTPVTTLQACTSASVVLHFHKHGFGLVLVYILVGIIYFKQACLE